MVESTFFKKIANILMFKIIRKYTIWGYRKFSSSNFLKKSNKKCEKKITTNFQRFEKKIILNDSICIFGITQLSKLGWVLEVKKDNCQGHLLLKS